MKNTGMESFVNCPKCGELTQVVLEPFHDVGGFLEILTAAIGVTKTNHFEGKARCKCGIMLDTKLSVMAEE